MSGWIQVAGWTLVHSLWQGMLVAGLAALALQLFRSASPRARYAVLCGALTVLVASPLITASLMSSGSEGLSVDVSLAATPQAVSLPAATATDAGTTSRSLPGLRQRIDAVIPVLVLGWLVGVGIFLIRLAGGWWRIRRLHRTAAAAAVSSWQAVADRMAASLGLRHFVRVVDWPSIDTPTVLGWMRPVVLLPVAALAALAPAQVEAILVHELAHVRRHDYLINLFQTVAETLFFYHPAVWWISGRIRVEREHCCDDVVVQVCGDATGYAKALVEIASWHTGRETLAVAATGGPLLARVRRLLNDDKHERPGAHPIVAVFLVAVFVTVAGGIHQMPGFATAAQAPPIQWQTGETDHFTIAYTSELRTQAEQVASDVERAYSQVATALRHDIPFRPALLLFASRADMERAVANRDLLLSAPAERIMLVLDPPEASVYSRLVEEITRLFRPSTNRVQAQPATPAFEVVSIRPNTSGTLGSTFTQRPDGGVSITNQPVRTLIGRSYDPPPIDIIGLPDWAVRDRYDVMATASLPNPPTPADRRAMMLAMLAERFQYAAHVEKREMATFDLVTSRSDGQPGAGMTPTQEDCEARGEAERAAAEQALAAGQVPPRPPLRPQGSPCSIFVSGPRMEGDMTMATLATMLRLAAGRYVVDKTGLDGYYRLVLTYNRLSGIRPPSATVSADDPPSVFTAVQEQLGLKLEPSRSMIDVLVVDRIERPTEI